MSQALITDGRAVNFSTLSQAQAQRIRTLVASLDYETRRAFHNANLGNGGAPVVPSMVSYVSANIAEVLPVNGDWNQAFTVHWTYPSTRVAQSIDTVAGVAQLDEAMPSGKTYLEIEITAHSANVNTIQFGLATIYNGSGSSITAGTDNSVRIYAAGTRFNAGGTQENPGYTTQPSVGQSIMLAYDSTTRDVWFGANGAWGVGADPAAGTNPTFNITGFAANVYPSVQSSTAGTQLTLLTADSTYQHTRPVGFNSI